MFRPKEVLLFDPKNPELSVADVMTSDYIRAMSPKILYWHFDRTTNRAAQDDLDSVYGEKSSGEAKDVFIGPKRVYMFIEFNPIIIELTRLGVEQIEEITCFTNIADFLDITGTLPKPGDLFRISYIQEEDKYRNRFYTVGSVSPRDLFNGKHLNYVLFSELTPLDHVPQNIKNFMDLL